MNKKTEGWKEEKEFKKILGLVVSTLYSRKEKREALTAFITKTLADTIRRHDKVCADRLEKVVAEERERILSQSRRVRNYSKTDDIFEAVPINFINNKPETSIMAKEIYPPVKTVEEMEVGDTVGFNDGNKHWTITRDE